MANVPTRVFDRLVTGLRRFQSILAAAKSRDAGEADTSTIVKDLLSEVFGYDKYGEITSEYAIKGTYCDLAIKLEGKLQLLVEVKAIGLDLKEPHAKQAMDYAANQGVDWVILTNGSIWRVYRVLFTQPIAQEVVFECDLLSLNTKNKLQVESLFLLSREAQSKSALHEYHVQRQAMNRFFLGAMVVSEPVLEVMRRELKRVSPGVRIDIDDLRECLLNEVLKRDVIEGERFEEARKRINKAQGRALRARAAKAGTTDGEEGESVPTEVADGVTEDPGN